MRRNLHGAAVLAGLGLAALVGVARASSVESLPDDELVRRARIIVHADVTSVRAEWDDAHKRIFTLVDLAPRETLKGDVAPIVTMKLIGGQRDGLTMIVHGMPQFHEGEEVVVFLTPAHETSGVTLPVGLGQGKWTVTKNPQGERIATRSLAGAHIVPRPGEHPRVLATTAKLDDLLAAIRAEVARQKTAGANK
jgi:hypothetical protein